MPKGVEVETGDGFAAVTFTDTALAGPALRKLISLVGPELIETDTSGTRRRYHVPESAAREAGLLDEPAKKAEPVKKAAPVKAPAKKAEPVKKAAPVKAPAKKTEEPAPVKPNPFEKKGV